MGYDLHITRRRFWADEETGDPIGLDEWRACVDADPTMRWSVSEKGLAFWIPRAEDRDRDDLPWLWWSADRISSKNPASEVRRKMWSVAQSLGAHLQGDDGELYGQDGEMLDEPDGVQGMEPGRVRAKPWWKFW